MPDETRTNSTAPSPDDAPGKGDAAMEAESAETAADERSLEERIEEALSSLSEVLEQADPFGDLATAAARAAGKDKDQDADDGASFEPPADGDGGEVPEASAASEAPAAVEEPGVAVDADAADEVAAGEPEPVEASAGVAASLDGMTPPEPEESIESIESLLGEVEAALSDAEPAASVSDDATNDAEAPPEPTPEDESALLAAALNEVDEFDPAGGADLPEPSLEAELAHEASLAAAYEEGEPSLADAAAVDIADEIAAIDEAEGVSEPVGAEEPAAAPDLDEEPSTPMDAAPEAAAPEPDTKPETKPKPERATPTAPAEVAASASEASEKPTKPKKEPLLARLRGGVATRVYRVCTAMSGPLTRLPVSMRDPLGAIAAFTLINALLVWVLVLVLR